MISQQFYVILFYLSMISSIAPKMTGFFFIEPFEIFLQPRSNLLKIWADAEIGN